VAKKPHRTWISMEKISSTRQLMFKYLSNGRNAFYTAAAAINQVPQKILSSYSTLEFLRQK
jgi:hypothetical protein